MIHLDTNVAIALMNNRHPALRARFDDERAKGRKIDLSAITYHELCYGAANSAARTATEKSSHCLWPALHLKSSILPAMTPPRLGTFELI